MTGLSRLQAQTSAQQCLLFLTLDYRNSYNDLNGLNHYRLGMRSFVEGILSTEQEVAQQEHMHTVGENRRSAARWVAILTTKLWNLSFQMWDHWNKEAKQ